MQDIISTLNPNKAPGYDNITAVILKQLPRKGQMTLLYILNAILRLNYWPRSFKVAQIIMILKQCKNPANVTSYRPISLLPLISKVVEKLLLNNLIQETNPQTWIPDHQFGFRRAHSTIQQKYRIANIITHALNNKQYCTAVFPDIAQAFDKVWHPGLLYKIKRIFPSKYYNLLKSYLRERSFEVKIIDETSNRLPIRSGVPRGSLQTHYYKLSTNTTYPQQRKRQ
jgi:hypothetical protein